MIISYFLIGYLFGNIQAAYILVRILKGKDIRKQGHGNSGASNVVLNYGIKLGIVVALIDILKAYIAIRLALYISRTYFIEYDYILFLTCLGVFLGHCHPFYMKFKGGKGTAVIIGSLFAVGLIPGFIGLFSLITVTLITDYIALGALGLNLSMLGLAIYLGYDKISLAIVGLILFMVLGYHKKNYLRIYKKEEKRVSQSIFKH